MRVLAFFSKIDRIPVPNLIWIIVYLLFFTNGYNVPDSESSVYANKLSILLIEAVEVTTVVKLREIS